MSFTNNAPAPRFSSSSATLAALTIAAGVMLPSRPALAVDIFQTVNSTSDNVIHANGAIWGSPADAPVAGNHYISDGSITDTLRTGTGGSGTSFAGDSLTLRNGVTFIVKRSYTADYIAESGAIFSAGADGRVIGGTILVASGQNTVFNSTNRDFGFNAVISGGGEIAIQGSGSGAVTINSASNTFSGTWAVDGGILEMGAGHVLGTGSLVLNGGTFSTGGFSQTLGTLGLSADSFIDLGDGASALVFDDSSAITWDTSFSLSILNYTEGVDSIRFGTGSDGLTGLQLSRITLNGESAHIDSAGYLTLAVIPEPSACALIGGLGALLLAVRHRRQNPVARAA